VGDITHLGGKQQTHLLWDGMCVQYNVFYNLETKTDMN